MLPLRSTVTYTIDASATNYDFLTEDFEGQTRDALRDVGADEFDVAGNVLCKVSARMDLFDEAIEDADLIAALAAKGHEELVARDDLVRQMEAHGFRVAGEHTFLPYQYFLVFELAR